VSSPYTPFPQSDDQGRQGQPYPQGSGNWQPGYLQGGPVGFGEAISQALKNILTFNGRASRSAYWWIVLATTIVGVGSSIVGAAIHFTALQYIVNVLIFLVILSLSVRRLHDINRSGYWLFLGLIPIAGSIVLLVFDCLRGTPGPNRFG
jgi:uncharacterized membrane protein YhaH (DUF805 family)